MPSTTEKRHVFRWTVLRVVALTALATPTQASGELAAVQTAVYTAPAARSNDWFGVSVALDAGLALIGSPQTPGQLLDPSLRIGDDGAAFLFDTSSHRLIDTITQGDLSLPRRRIAYEVALHDGIAVIGNSHALQAESSGPSTAAVYDAGLAIPIGQLESPGFPSVDRPSFGSSVAVYGEHVLIGNPRSVGVPNPNSTDFGGSAHLYRIDDLLNPDLLSPAIAPQYAGFGIDVALNDRYAVVANLAYPSAFVFDTQTQRELHEVMLPIPTASLDDDMSLAVEGNTAVISHLPRSASRGSSVYVVDLARGEVVHHLSPEPESERSPNYGASVAIDDGIVVVGDPGVIDGEVTSGRAFLFDAMTGTPIGRLTPTLHPTGLIPNAFGVSVDINDGHVLVGALRSGEVGSSGPGAAYLFRLVPEPATAMTVVACAIGAALPRRQLGS